MDNGEIIYVNTSILWSTSDGYNIDIDNSLYRKFLEIVLSIGSKYDLIKTDLINRFLTPSSLKTYDLTENKKMIKLLRLYGWEFDQIRQFIDSLVYINKISYDKINSIPNQLIANMAKTLGWEYFSLVNEKELMESFLTIDENERNLNKDLLPAEVDLELWHRILNNTNYFWKSKGTRESIKSMFLLIGIPEPFINITEFLSFNQCFIALTFTRHSKSFRPKLLSRCTLLLSLSLSGNPPPCLLPVKTMDAIILIIELELNDIIFLVYISGPYQV